MQNNISASSNDATMNMLRVLTKIKRGIHINHINAQSLNNKIDEFRLLVENSSVDVICVSETWLKETTPNSIINLNGYQIFRADRTTRGGGVAIYIKNNIKCKFISSSSNNPSNSNQVEYIFIELTSFGKKLLLGCVYRPHRNIPTDTFLSYLEELSLSYADAVIAGDFNSDLLTETTFMDDLLSFGIKPINCSVPTHFTSSSNTLLDLFLVCDSSKVLLYDQLSAACFSKHDLIFTTYDFNLNYFNRTCTYRDFKHINYQLLDQYFSNINWSTVYYMPSVNDQLYFFENNISNLYDMFVPVKTKLLKQNTRPWFSLSISNLIKRRDLAYSRWKRFKIPLLHDEYRRIRKEVNR